MVTGIGIGILLILIRLVLVLAILRFLPWLVIDGVSDVFLGIHVFRFKLHNIEKIILNFYTFQLYYKQ